MGATCTAWRSGRRAAVGLAAAVALAACASSPPTREGAREPTASRVAPADSSSRPDVWIDANSAPPVASAAPDGERGPPSAEGKDFAEEVRLLFRTVACAGDEPLPRYLDAALVREHCAELLPSMEAYRAHYIAKAKPFLASLAPTSVPRTVVYPFGGGDLLSALTTYADATEITTISLELAGDPRRIHGMMHDELARSLRKVRATMGDLLSDSDYSKSETLKRTQRGDIPGQLAFFLVALAIHGFEPVSLRYFRLEPDGAIHYLSLEEIEAIDSRIATHRKESWTPPDFSEAFANAELRFRPQGGDASAPPRVHRHIAVNLADDRLGEDAPLLRHLAAKGKVAAMTKAASYLLWKPQFSRIRAYLLANAELMISDSTGIPPDLAKAAGFVDETYGSFERSLLRADRATNEAFRALWRGQAKRKLDFRFGYLDSAGAAHLLVMKRPQ